MFALELSKAFGYEIEEIRDFENCLVHAYCIGRIKDKIAYIDIRGITTDPEEFFVEFSDDINVENGCIEESQFEYGCLSVSRYSDANNYLAQHHNLVPAPFSGLEESAKAFISDNSCIYLLDTLRKKSLSFQIRSASTRAAESQTTSQVKAKEPEPEI